MSSTKVQTVLFVLCVKRKGNPMMILWQTLQRLQDAPLKTRIFIHFKH